MEKEAACSDSDGDECDNYVLSLTEEMELLEDEETVSEDEEIAWNPHLPFGGLAEQEWR